MTRHHRRRLAATRQKMRATVLALRQAFGVHEPMPRGGGAGMATMLAAGLREAVDRERDPGRREFNRLVAKTVYHAPPAIDGEGRREE